MKICFVTTSYIRDKDDYYSRFVFEQSRSILLADPQNEVIVIAPHGRGLLKRETIEGVRVVRFQYFWPARLQKLAYQNEGLFNTLRHSFGAIIALPFFLLSMLLCVLRHSKNAQIIHAQWIPTAMIALIIKSLKKIPVVVSVRGADINTLKGSAWGRWFTKAILKRVDTILTVSNDFQSLLIDELKLPGTVRVLYNGIHENEFAPRPRKVARTELGLAQNTRIVLYVGALIKRKGVDLLLGAAKEVLKEHGDIQILLVGEGPEEGSLKALTEKLGLSKHVRFVGKIDRHHTHSWMNAADILVLPSYSEGRPNVVLEALGSQLPVIASDIPGTKELIEDGRNGLLFSSGNTRSLAEKLLFLLNNPTQAQQLGAEGRRTILNKKLTWKQHGQELTEIYSSTLNQKQKTLCAA